MRKSQGEEGEQRRQASQPATSSQAEELVYIPGKKELPAQSGGYVFPRLRCWAIPQKSGKSRERAIRLIHSKLLQDTLASFGVQGKVHLRLIWDLW